MQDTGTAGNYVSLQVPLDNECKIQHGLTVQLPDNSVIASTHKGNLQLPNLPASSTIAYKFPNIQKSLLSMCDICDKGGTAVFSKNDMHAILDGQVILRGKRDSATGLWLVKITSTKPTSNPIAQPLSPTTEVAAAVLEATNTKRELVCFHHATCFYPVKSIWIKAIRNGNYATFPGLTPELVQKYLPAEIPIMLGYQHLIRKGLRSTTAQVANVALIAEKPVPEIYTTIIPLPRMICTDQTGKFSVHSKSGNNYLFVLYDYYANAILGAAIPDRKTASIQTACLTLYNSIKQKGYETKLIRLDNEISNEHMNLLEEKLQLKVQLAPPHNHRQNLAERAIQICKNHFIAGLSGADPSFPIILWDTLIPQANITINLLRD